MLAWDRHKHVAGLSLIMNGVASLEEDNLAVLYYLWPDKRGGLWVGEASK